MGTRCLTTFYDTSWCDEKTPSHVVTVYRHWDGYPSGHGSDLAEFLDGVILGNGIPHPKPEKFANGTGRLATQFIAVLDAQKHDPDIMPENVSCWQEFHYVVTGNMNTGAIDVEVFEGEDRTTSIFKGTVSAYKQWIAELSDEY